MTAAIPLPPCFEGNVMRTPWRFVADLVSRKPKPESPAVAPKTIALEYKPVPEEDHPGTEAAAVDHSAEAGADAKIEVGLHDQETSSTDVEAAAPVEAEAPAAPVDEEEPTALLTPQQPEQTSPAPTLTEVAETLVKRAPPRRKNIDPTVESVVSATQSDEVAPIPLAGPKSFMDEMADLDAEVDALRRQLAKKLIEQNAQLRRMLARFDGR
ncbi:MULTISPECIES: hypothetical protein [unclassified Rhizobium]|uniref:hypothetical protein n=1 Tax=unclassified Rhizobium TaxID=2613769 RepID=UPI001C82EBED|nr:MULTISPECIES: hypothetical protein [unclassified Rhizobium]MBX5166814.1 hypothetical protein [Rhizobium sp. NZLR4b]MBX5186352.1 hypothetical protein [Rhizobium sp. NZLR5]